MANADLYGSLGVALAVGLLLGVQREQSVSTASPEKRHLPFGGIRTFPLVALAAALSTIIGQKLGLWLIGLAFGILAVPILMAYADDLKAGRDRGITSESAFVLTFLLGVLAASDSVAETRERWLLVAGIGVLATGLLALKQSLHHLVGRVSSDDVLAMVKLAVVAVVVLPLLPDRPMGPLAVLNPRNIGLMVALIAGVGFLGYVAIRALGPGKGLGVTGLLGGLVSSTAVTLALAGRSKQDRAVASLCALGVVLACTVMPLRILATISIVNFELVKALAVPLGAVALAGLLASLILYLRNRASDGQPTAEDEAARLRNPFKLTSAVKFGLLFAAILWVCKAMTLWAPRGGIYLAALLAGTTDVDAISLSMAGLVRSSTLSRQAGASAILIAAGSNTLVKAGLAVSLGGPGFRRPVLLAFAGMLVAGAIGVGVLWLP